MIDTSTPNSPGWWLNRLIKLLGEKRDGYQRLDDYYRNLNGIPVHASRAVGESYRRLMAMSSTNFAELAVEATRERMQPLGFRTGADPDELGDREAWRIWQANSLDADHTIVDRGTLTMGTSYMIVGPVDDEIGAPLITPEDPREVIAVCDPARRRRVLAALKVFHDDIESCDRAYLYLPGYVIRARRATPENSTTITMNADGFVWDGEPQKLPALVVPVVPFRNRDPANPSGEFEPHLTVLDRINYTILSRLEAMTMQAYRQRGIKGLPLHDADGEEIDYSGDFLDGPGELWQLPETAEIWESGLIDLTPILESVKADVRDFASVTRTPMTYFFPDAAQGSAEGAALMREGLVFKVKDRMTQQGESYEQVMSLAFLFAGDAARASRTDMEIIWAPPERYTLGERGSAASQAAASGMPWQGIARHIWQMSPQEVARLEADRQAEALLSEPADVA